MKRVRHRVRMWVGVYWISMAVGFLSFCMELRGQTNPLSGVRLTMAMEGDGNATLAWNPNPSEGVDVEYSQDLSNWSVVSGDNATGMLRHFFGNTPRGFYRLKAPQPRAVRSLVFVQGGTLPQGSGFAGQSVEDFMIGKFEVAYDEWIQVRDRAVEMGYVQLANTGNGSAGNHPVREIDWHTAVLWCNALSEIQGLQPVYLEHSFGSNSANGAVYRGTTPQRIPFYDPSANGYRLPWETEWEWAARGGVSSQGYTYSGSNSLDEVAWWWNNSYQPPVVLWNNRGTRPIGQKAGNELGLHDMSGNVMELVWDPSRYGAAGIRGGYFNSGQGNCAVVSWGASSLNNNFDGLRLARNASP